MQIFSNDGNIFGFIKRQWLFRPLMDIFCALHVICSFAKFWKMLGEVLSLNSSDVAFDTRSLTNDFKRNCDNSIGLNDIAGELI